MSHVLYLRPVDPAAAEGLVELVYRQVVREFVLVGPVLLLSPLPAVLAGVWSCLRESYLVGQVPRAAKEAMIAELSRRNACPFCVEAHTLFHRAATLAAGDDARTASLVAWAAAHLTPGAEILRRPPFAAAEAPELVGTAVTFHALNRLVQVFLPPSPVPLGLALASQRRWWQRWMLAWLGRRFVPVVRGRVAPGASRELLPAAELPADLAWAAPSPHVAGAFAACAAAIGQAGVRAVPAAERRRLPEV